VYHDRQDLTDLIGSRICHDLISPLGAISNGLELLAMTGMANSPELDLINQSIRNANSKIRFFRVAYGKAAHGATLARGEISSILDDYFQGSRLSVVWHPNQELMRREVKLAFLAIQCLETALPYGGEIDISHEGAEWSLIARGEKLATDLSQWPILEGQEANSDLGAEHVHFGMLAALTQWRKPAISVALNETSIVLKL
jgi:histidine phosphotransferase ChpT